VLPDVNGNPTRGSAATSCHPRRKMRTPKGATCCGISRQAAISPPAQDPLRRGRHRPYDAYRRRDLPDLTSLCICGVLASTTTSRRRAILTDHQEVDQGLRNTSAATIPITSTGWRVAAARRGGPSRSSRCARGPASSAALATSAWRGRALPFRRPGIGAVPRRRARSRAGRFRLTRLRPVGRRPRRCRT
jgi:hypothetical protein